MKNIYEIKINSDFYDPIVYYIYGKRVFRATNDGGLEKTFGLNVSTFHHNFVRGGQIYISALEGDELREAREKISKAK